MEKKMDAVTIAIAVGVAAYAAIAMGYVAQHGFGFSQVEIRSTALATAVLIAALMAIEFFGKKLGKAK